MNVSSRLRTITTLCLTTVLFFTGIARWGYTGEADESPCRVDASLSFSEDDTGPYRILLESGSGFHGPGRETTAETSLREVVIGCIAPVSTQEGRHLRTAVSMALEKANIEGGVNGLPCRLVSKDSEGPWGVVANRIVELVYDDAAWCIIGGLDGTETHLAQLIAAKAWIPILSPGATDRSIDYANVPWVFRIMPDDAKQAAGMMSWLVDNNMKNICILTGPDRDSRSAGDRLLEAAKRARVSVTFHREFSSSGLIQPIPSAIVQAADALIIWGEREAMMIIVETVRMQNTRGTILLPASAVDVPATILGDLGPIVVTAPFDPSVSTAERDDFTAKFTTVAGETPTIAAYAAWDSVMMAVQALRRGLNRASMRDSLAEMIYDGLTGVVAFDTLGGVTRMPDRLHFPAADRETGTHQPNVPRR